MKPISPKHLLQQLQWRYATKKFDASQAIPAETWEALEDSLILTPSSFGLQPWHFLVVQNPALRQELLPHSWGQPQVTDCSHFVVLAAKTSVTEEEIDAFLALTAQLRAEEIETLNPYREMMLGFTQQMDAATQQHWSQLQTYIALGQLMSSAALLGIDACPMEGIVPAEYDRILGLPEKGLTASVACALGYRSKDDKYAEASKVRFEKSELLTRL